MGHNTETAVVIVVWAIFIGVIGGAIYTWREHKRGKVDTLDEKITSIKWA